MKFAAVKLLKEAPVELTEKRHLRELLCEGRLPEAWLPPSHVVEWRTRTRLRKTLVADISAKFGVAKNFPDFVEHRFRWV